MAGDETLLRSLLRLRHLTTYEAFHVQFRQAALSVAKQDGDHRISHISVSERTWERWCAGDLAGLPRPDACRVLEAMFSRPARELLSRAPEPGPEVAAASPPDDDIDRTLSMAARRARQFSALADATNVGRDGLDELRDEVVRLAAAYPFQPAVMLVGDLASVQEDTLTLLEGRQPPAYTHDLYLVAGLASGMMAKASHDMRNPRAAMTHARLAWQCAANSGHSPLAAWVRAVESLITYWAGRTADARAYAVDGLAIDGVSGSVRVWLASLLARAEGALGNADAALAAVRAAEDARDLVRPDDLDAIGGICEFPRERQMYYAADAAASLPAFLSGSALGARAAAYATEAITAYGASSLPAFGDQAGSHAALAVARIRAGDVDGAAEAIDPVLALPAAMRINGVVTCVAAVHRELASVPESAAAAAAREAIEGFIHVPGALAL